MQEVAVLHSCPTEQLQGIPLNGASLSLLQGPLVNTKKSQFSSKAVNTSLWKHLKYKCWISNLFVCFVCFLDAGRFFFFILLKPKSSPLLPHGKDFFIKTCLIIPLCPLLCISSQASMLLLKIKMCTWVQKLDAEPNVDHTLKEAKTLCKLNLHCEWEPKKKKKPNPNQSLILTFHLGLCLSVQIWEGNVDLSLFMWPKSPFYLAPL